MKDEGVNYFLHYICIIETVVSELAVSELAISE